MLGNPAAIERAVKAGIPECEKALERRRRLEDELAKIDRTRGRVLDLIEKDALTTVQAETKLRELKEREAGLRTQLDEVTSVLDNIPNAETVRLFGERFEDSIVILDDEGNTYAGGNDV